MAQEAIHLNGLMDAVALKNQAALADLYKRLFSRLYSIAYSMLASRQDAEEIVCDVFLYIWNNAKQYDRTRGGAVGWLVVLTRGRAIDRIRRRKATLSMDDEQVSGWVAASIANRQGPDDVLAHFQDGCAIHDALSSLSPLRERLVRLAFFHDLTHQEIAEVSALPQGTVKSHVRRALISMRGALQCQSGAVVPCS